jgi:hypothetical protein
MPTVPKMLSDPTATENLLGDSSTPGPSQIMMAAALMHGYGRLTADGRGSHSDALGGGGGVGKMPRRSKRFSQRSK